MMKHSLKLSARTNAFEKVLQPFCANFFMKNMIQGTPYLRELFLTIKITWFYIHITST